jgi:hypothetical protein
MFLVNCVWLTAKLLRIHHDIVNIAVQLLLKIIDDAGSRNLVISENNCYTKMLPAC